MDKKLLTLTGWGILLALTLFWGSCQVQKLPPSPDEEEGLTLEKAFGGGIDSGFTLSNGGDAKWFPQESEKLNNKATVQSGRIHSNQRSVLTAVVEGPGVLRFSWKVSSEASKDQLSFSLDGEVKNVLSGEQDWNEREFEITRGGSHTLIWEYSKDGEGKAGRDSAWIGGFTWEKHEEITLREALDASPQLELDSEGDWYGQNTVTYQGMAAAKSAPVEDGQSSRFTAAVEGSGELRFFWKVSSEENKDYLRFSINDEEQTALSGEQDWAEYTYTFYDTESRILKWEYTKDAAGSRGDDSGYIAGLHWTPAEEITLAQAVSIPEGINISSGGDARWFGQSMETYGDDPAAAQSGFISDNESSTLTVTLSGGGEGSFFWKISSEADKDKLRFFVDDKEIALISGEQDWVEQTFSIPGTLAHELKWVYSKDGAGKAGLDRGYLGHFSWTLSEESILSQALEAPAELDIQVSGDAPWFGQELVDHQGGPSAQSGRISDNQSSRFHTTVEGSGNVQFFWKTSSEEGGDLLRFYVDGKEEASLSGEEDWQEFNFRLFSSVTHELKWEYSKDASGSAGDDSAYVAKLNWDALDPLSLTQALSLGQGIILGEESGDAQWFGMSSPGDGGDSQPAAQSGAVSHSEKSSLTAGVNGAGTLSFSWKVSSQETADFLTFYVDGEAYQPAGGGDPARISGETDWKEETVVIQGLQTHALKWEYSKDASGSAGDDSGWVRLVSWNPSQDISLADALSAPSGLSVVAGGDVDWTGQDQVVPQGGSAAAESGAAANGQRSSLVLTTPGSGSIGFFWKVSSEENKDYLRFYIDGVEQEGISGEQDWQEKTFSFYAPGIHELKWEYSKDAAGAAGSDRGWVSRLTWSPRSIALEEALGNSPGLSFTSSGDADWFGQEDTVSSPGDPAAQSGIIDHGETTAFSTTIEGSGTVSFLWKVDSEVQDKINFYVNDVLHSSLSGDQDWVEVSQTYYNDVSRTFKWEYRKNGSLSGGKDSAWVESLSWTASPLISLETALNPSEDLSFANEGYADWFGQRDTVHNHTAAAQSGEITHNEYSSFTTRITGGGQGSFHWKVSSEAGDKLNFYLDGVLQGSLSGEQDWQNYDFTIPGNESHELKWEYRKDQADSAGRDSGWVAGLTWTPEARTDMTTALSDTTGRTFTSLGDAAWYGQDQVVMTDQPWSAQSGYITDGQTTGFEITISGGYHVNFSWKVDSEQSGDFLRFFLNGEEQISLSGDEDWTNYELITPSTGDHSLKWSYEKNGSVSTGRDSAWVSELTLTKLVISSLEDALDNPSGIIFSSVEGTIPWVGQNIETFDGVDAAKNSDLISDTDFSVFKVTIPQKGVLNFRMKQSSNERYNQDKGRIFVFKYEGDNLVSDLQRNYTTTTGWYTSFTGNFIGAPLFFSGVKDLAYIVNSRSVPYDWESLQYLVERPGDLYFAAQGDVSILLDTFEFTPEGISAGQTFNSALELSDDYTVSLGSLPWEITTSLYSGIHGPEEELENILEEKRDSLRSFTGLGNSQASEFSVSGFQGRGYLDFSSMVSSEESSSDGLYVYVNDEPYMFIGDSEVLEFSPHRIPLPPSLPGQGGHTVRFAYEKFSDPYNAMYDAVWVDQLVWTPLSAPDSLEGFGLGVTLSSTTAGGNIPWYSMIFPENSLDSSQEGDIRVIRSGHLSEGESSQLTLTMDGPGTLNLEHYLAPNMDAAVTVDGESRGLISSGTGSGTSSVQFSTDGEHTVTFTVSKNDYIFQGAWIYGANYGLFFTNINFTPDN